jgi:hypothetical protein
MTYVRLSFYPAYPVDPSRLKYQTYVYDNEPTSTSGDPRPPSEKFRDESRAGRESLLSSGHR